MILQGIGILAPWENRVAENVTIQLPGHDPHHPVPVL